MKNIPESEKKVKLSDASSEEICAASRPEACDEEYEYLIWFNRLNDEEKKIEFALQNPTKL
jgi:hypothetical protein